MDVRHRFRFSPTYAIPGMKSPGQMLEGWAGQRDLGFSDRLCLGPERTKQRTIGAVRVKNGDRAIPSPNSGNWQCWNYTGPHSAFSNAGDTPIPCYGGGIRTGRPV